MAERFTYCDGRGNGGELHQQSGLGQAGLTTAQGCLVADDQNSLRSGERGPTLLEDHVMRENFFISTMSGYRSG